MEQELARPMSRRGALKLGMAAGAVALGTSVLAGANPAWADSPRAGVGGGGGGRPVLPDIADTSHTTPRVAKLVKGFFEAKSAHDAPRLLSYYANPEAFFLDAANGLGAPTWDAINGFFSSFFASGLPAAAVSYALRVVGDESGAVVELIDTPEFFGIDLRVLTSLTFDRNLKIIRAVDYWDGRTSQVVNTVGPSYPTDFQDGRQTAGRTMVKTARALQAAFGAGDAPAAVKLMTPDVVVEDMAARTWLRGSLPVQRYFARALGLLPYGAGATVLHVSGGDPGGGYEWQAGPAAAPLRRGHTALELDRDGRISRMTVMYDASVLSDARYGALVGLAAEPPR